MKKIIPYIVALILMGIGCLEKIQFWETKFGQTGIIACITLLVTFITENYGKIRFFFITKWLHSKKDIRISIAYLYRIKAGNSYLLVKSRTRNYYQPVGGCYKTLPGSEQIFEDLAVKPDRKFETEKGIAKNDLRIYVKGKNVIKFLEWFDSKKDREISPWREFCEELIDTNILPWSQFRFIDYKFKGQVKSPIITMDNGGKGMFIFDIYDLVVNDEQKPILEKLQETTATQFIWVSDSLIQSLGHDVGMKEYRYEISPHTKYAQNIKWSKENK